MLLSTHCTLKHLVSCSFQHHSLSRHVGPLAN
jgi:hypothetical protein